MFKKVVPSPEQRNLRIAVLDAMRPYAESVTDMERVAMLSHMLGQFIAAGDYPDGITAEHLMRMVLSNIELGNQDVVQGLQHQLMNPEGNA